MRPLVLLGKLMGPPRNMPVIWRPNTFHLDGFDDGWLKSNWWFYGTLIRDGFPRYCDLKMNIGCCYMTNVVEHDFQFSRSVNMDVIQMQQCRLRTYKLLPHYLGLLLNFSESVVGRFSRFAVSAVDSSSIKRVENQEAQPNKFRDKFSNVPFIALCLGGYGIAGVGWWGLHFRSGVALWVCYIVIGIALSLWGGWNWLIVGHNEPVRQVSKFPATERLTVLPYCVVGVTYVPRIAGVYLKIVEAKFSFVLRTKCVEIIHVAHEKQRDMGGLEKMKVLTGNHKWPLRTEDAPVGRNVLRNTELICFPSERSIFGFESIESILQKVSYFAMRLWVGFDRRVKAQELIMVDIFHRRSFSDIGSRDIYLDVLIWHRNVINKLPNFGNYIWSLFDLKSFLCLLQSRGSDSDGIGRSGGGLLTERVGSPHFAQLMISNGTIKSGGDESSASRNRDDRLYSVGALLLGISLTFYVWWKAYFGIDCIWWLLLLLPIAFGCLVYGFNVLLEILMNCSYRPTDIVAQFLG
jgi:hypothetical protein